MGMTITGAEATAQIQTQQQQALDNARKNAALNALTQTYGAVGGDPETWMNASKAKAAADEVPYAGPTAAADLQGKQITNAEGQQKNNNQNMFAVGRLLQGQKNPDGSLNTDLLDNPAIQQFAGIPPERVPQLKQALSGPNGSSVLDNMMSAGVGPAGSLASGGMTQVIDPATGQITLVRGTKGGGIVENQLGTGLTTPQAQNANTRQNNSIIGPDGKPNQAYIDAKTQIVSAAAKAGVTLTPEATVMLATNAALTGKLPSFGMGGSKNTTAVANQMAAQGTTGDQLAANAQTYKSSGSALTDLARSSPMSAGGLVRSAGAVIQHIDVLSKYIDALGNKNLNVANYWSQKFKEQTGQAAPTNFNIQKQIVSSEMQKFLVGGRATLSDRKELSDSISNAHSPQQLRDAIDTLKADLGAQLVTQYEQFDGLGVGKNYLKVLTPAARQLVTGIGDPDMSPPPGVGGKQQPNNGWTIKLKQ